MAFIDEVRLYLNAGNGGDGCVSFRREKFIEFGGPDGGNGGRGGNIIFVSDTNLNTLLSLRYKKYVKADNGKCGKKRNKSGRSGKDIILKVPVGTQIIDEENEKIIADFDKSEMKFEVAKGGKGGLGNTNFKSSNNRIPKYFTCGQFGEKKCILLRLKFLSDVGIIGITNAGKSKFLTRCSNADTKIGDYLFTTIRPYLGVAKIDDKEIVIADIPGIIFFNQEMEFRPKNKFLKHIERCEILLHLIDITQNDIISVYNCTRNELKLYSNNLIKKEEIVILNKCDLLKESEILKKKNCLVKYINKEVMCLSINDNLKPVLSFLSKKLKKNNIKKYEIYDPFY